MVVFLNKTLSAAKIEMVLFWMHIWTIFRHFSPKILFLSNYSFIWKGENMPELAGNVIKTLKVLAVYTFLRVLAGEQQKNIIFHLRAVSATKLVRMVFCCVF